MVSISVKADVSAAKAKLRRIRSDLIDKATVSALNKVGDKARAEMTRAITDEYMLTASEVRARLRVTRASRGRLIVILDPFASKRRGRSLNLIHFAKAARKAGRRGQLHFQIKRGGGKKVVKGAFIGNSGRTVFIRTPGQFMPGRINRTNRSKHAEAIKALQTIDVPRMFSAKRIRERVADKIRREFPIELQRAITMWASK